jgi:hypothetical protein
LAIGFLSTTAISDAAGEGARRAMQIFWRVVRLQGFLARNAGRYSQAPTKTVANIGIRQWMVRVGRLQIAQRFEHNFSRYFLAL